MIKEKDLTKKCIACGSKKPILFNKLSFSKKKDEVAICFGCAKEFLTNNYDFSDSLALPKTINEMVSFLDANEKIKIVMIHEIKPKEASDEISASLIESTLHKKIYGHDQYKKILAMTFARHLSGDFKEHLMVLGPTGTGKTLGIQTICDIYKTPLYICNSAMLSPSGYKGSSIDEIGHGLLKASGGDISLAEEGVVFLDEVDKGLLGAFGQEISFSLLRLLENDYLSTPKGMISTKNILFILGGSFTSALKEMGPSENGLWETKNLREILKNRFKVNDELFGRISNFCLLEPFNEEDYRNILANHLWKVIPDVLSFLKKRGSELKLTEDFIQYACKEAVTLGLGARGLRTIIKEELLDVMYSPELALNRDVIIGKISQKENRTIIGQN